MPVTRAMIVPAAGRGSRLGSALPKLLVPVNGRAMIDWVLDRHAEAVDRFYLVVAPGFLDQVRAHLAGRDEDVTLVLQREPTGMLDAILEPAAPVKASGADEVWVTWCDQVAVRRETVARLGRAMATVPPPALAFATIRTAEPYIHFDRDARGRITAVRQRREGAAMPNIGEGDIGLFAMSGSAYREWLPRYVATCQPGTTTHERNFLPFIPWLETVGQSVTTVPADDPIEAVGINTPEDLARLDRELARRSPP